MVERKALLIINLQNDFMPWGTVPVEGSDTLAVEINKIMDQYQEVIAVIDWHPADHISFAANHLWWKPGQTMDIEGQEILLWTMHCVQNSFGAELVNELGQKKLSKVIRKGIHPKEESFNAFEETDDDLEAYLKKKKIGTVHLCGLITEFDIKTTAIKAKNLGYKTVILTALSKGLVEKEIENALPEMRRQGIALN